MQLKMPSLQATVQTGTVIDYELLSSAVTHYKRLEYEYVNVPWIVRPEIDNITKPPERRPFESFMGNFVASGEQGFLQLMTDKQLPKGKYVCLTPCFRDEDVDDLHLTNFMKVELINTNDDAKVFDTIMDASSFFFGKIRNLLIKTNEGFDLVSRNLHIELGSYGLRTHGDLRWIYGTGCAEPRLSRAIQLERESENVR